MRRLRKDFRGRRLYFIEGQSSGWLTEYYFYEGDLYGTRPDVRTEIHSSRAILKRAYSLDISLQGYTHH